MQLNDETDFLSLSDLNSAPVTSEHREQNNEKQEMSERTAMTQELTELRGQLDDYRRENQIDAERLHSTHQTLDEVNQINEELRQELERCREKEQRLLEDIRLLEKDRETFGTVRLNQTSEEQLVSVEQQAMSRYIVNVLAEHDCYNLQNST